MGGWTPRLHPRISRASLSALTRAGLSDIPSRPAPWVSLTSGSRVRSVPRVPRACQGPAPSARGLEEGPGLAQPPAPSPRWMGLGIGAARSQLGAPPGLPACWAGAGSMACGVSVPQQGGWGPQGPGDRPMYVGRQRARPSSPGSELLLQGALGWSLVSPQGTTCLAPLKDEG